MRRNKRTHQEGMALVAVTLAAVIIFGAVTLVARAPLFKKIALSTGAPVSRTTLSVTGPVALPA